jgi:hypothetical protein
MTTQYREFRPFPPPGDYPRSCSGFCLACGAIVVGGVVPDVYDQFCPACGECHVVGVSDARLTECIDRVMIA